MTRVCSARSIRALFRRYWGKRRLSPVKVWMDSMNPDSLTHPGTKTGGGGGVVRWKMAVRGFPINPCVRLLLPQKNPRHLADTVGRSCQWRTRLALDPQHAPPRNTPRQREFARPTGSEPDLYRRAGACGTNIFGRPASTLVSRRLRVRLA